MEKIAIIGCGTMGHSIALAVAWAGLPVLLHGLDKTETTRALTGIQEKIDRLVTYGLVQADEAEMILEKIRFTQSLADLAADASFIIESIPENIELKQKLFAELDEICAPSVILATNTSGLNPDLIAEKTRHPQRVVVTHFWNPAHLIPLVEVVRSSQTDDATVLRAMELIRLINKKPVAVQKFVPGFVGNRLQFALLREALHLLESGVASKEDIDAAVTNGIGRRLSVTGPILSADMGGLDVFSSIADYLYRDLDNATESSPALKKLVAAEKFGAKNGGGFYDWNTAFQHTMNANREEELMRLLKEDRART